MATKITYQDANEKKEVREFLFSLFAKRHFSKIVGLAGPDINDYISYCKKWGYNEFEIFETDINVLMKQMMEVKKANALLKYGNILDADADRTDVLYDLDYCVTVRHMKEHIKKFTNNFIMTFSRRIGNEETVKQFFKAKKEKIVSIVTKFSPREYDVYKTEQGNSYIYIKYHDTSSMCCIAKIN